MTQKHTVLIIDDDREPLKFYVKMLQHEYSVVHKSGPDETFEYISMNKNIRIVLLDVMMNPGAKYKFVDTKKGLITGVFLAKDLLKELPHTPIIIFTNASNPNTIAMFNETNVKAILQKIDYPPFELKEYLDNIIRNE